MNKRFRILSLIGSNAALFLLSAALLAKVGSIKLEALVRMSDVIAVVRVDSIQSVGGLPIARAIPERVVKGQVGADGLYFVAGPTWTCDESTAIVGERALVFLRRPKKPTVSREMLGKPPVRVDLKPLYLISHSGRGRMPIRSVNDTDHVIVKANYVVLPRRIKTAAVQKGPLSDSIRSALLSDIVDTVAKGR